MVVRLKVLLVGINAKYIHSNPAIRSLRNYALPYKDCITISEYTINQYKDDILMDIYKQKPDFIGVSCYIWNFGMVKKVCRELRKVLPEVRLWLGGPEVSYDPEALMKELPFIDGIMAGEGEEAFLELMKFYVDGQGELLKIKGIYFRDGSKGNLVVQTPIRGEMDMDKIPFPYEDLSELENRIIYYESSRGCPYSCSYCLSSENKRVRFRNVKKVEEELLFFLENKVPQVKFVDRTFNCNHSHAMAVWQFIKEHDNGITNFHFEIAGEILKADEIELLNSMREGLVQLEIGVQSANENTLDAIHRKMSLERIKEVVHQIHKGENIHIHLDLIAGLPLEDFPSFRASFNEVYAMKPDQLQLGFLKVLKGSTLNQELSGNQWDIVYQEEPPYEVLYTKWISYDEILLLKKVESMTEIYYNSGQFEYSLKYLMHFFETPFDFFLELGNYYEELGLHLMSSSRMGRYETLLSFFEQRTAAEGKEEVKILKSLMVHDLFCREKLKSRPSFAEDYEAYKKKYQLFYQDKDRIAASLLRDIGTEDIKGVLHIEHYPFNVYETADYGIRTGDEQFILYDYKNRNPLNKQAGQAVVVL